MDTQNVIDFLKSQGHKFVKTTSCWWYNPYRNNIFFPFPFQRVIDPMSDEISQIFSNFPEVSVLRFMSFPLSNRGKPSYLWVCRRPYDFARLRQDRRTHTRKGLKTCLIRRISSKEILSEGVKAHQDTVKRHSEDAEKSISVGINPNFEKCPAYEAWGAFIETNLVSYILTIQVEDWVQILIHRSQSAYLKFYPNNALIFYTLREFLSRPNVSTVTCGWAPIAPKESLEHFKSLMGFEKELIRERIILKPALRFFLNDFVCKAVENIAFIFPQWEKMQMLAGFCRTVRLS